MPSAKVRAILAEESKLEARSHLGAHELSLS